MDDIFEVIEAKLLAGEKLNDTELSTMAYNGAWEEVGETHRWSTSVTTVYKLENGRVFVIEWERGNTEMQEDEFYEQPEEVELQEEWVKVTKIVRK